MSLHPALPMVKSAVQPTRRPADGFIRLDAIKKVFKTSAGEFVALRHIDLSFAQGEFTTIMGKSGSGKSTLINMITGIDHPTSGVVCVGDVELNRMNESQMAVWRGRTLGIVFQFFQLLPMLTVLENTMLPMDFSSVYPLAERESRAMELLRLVGLEEMAEKLPAALSGGQQQIAAMARALANDPPILIADEPTGNLDTRTEQRMLGIFDDLAAHGKTILIVTHDPTLARRSKRRVVISDGELINEHVAQALPVLTHTQMLKLTHLAVERTYEPDAVIVRQGAVDEGLYVVTRGTVDVLSRGRNRKHVVVTQLGPGQYFCEIDLLETEYCDLTFRASSAGPVEILGVNLGDFNQFIAQTPSVDAALRRTAVERSAVYCAGGANKSALRRWLWRGRAGTK